MQDDTCLTKVISLENALKVKEATHLLFVEAASDLVFPLLSNLSLVITASHCPFTDGNRKGYYNYES